MWVMKHSYIRWKYHTKIHKAKTTRKPKKTGQNDVSHRRLSFPSLSRLRRIKLWLLTSDTIGMKSL